MTKKFARKNSCVYGLKDSANEMGNHSPYNPSPVSSTHTSPGFPRALHVLSCSRICCNILTNQNKHTMDHRVATLELQLSRQKKTLQRLIVVFMAIILLLSSLFLFSFTTRQDDKVLRVKGIVIVDDNGRERILIGAPLPSAKNRVRTDTARVRQLWAGNFPNPDQYMKWYAGYDHQSNGILILDEQGFDKVCLGDGVPDANIGPRIGKQTGLIFCDGEGSERGGLGIIDVGNKKNRVVLALDGDNGMDATGISVLEDGETGFFAGGPKGYNMFIGSAPAGSYSDSLFFGMTLNQKKKTLYKLNITDTIKRK